MIAWRLELSQSFLWLQSRVISNLYLWSIAENARHRRLSWTSWPVGASQPSSDWADRGPHLQVAQMHAMKQRESVHIRVASYLKTSRLRCQHEQNLPQSRYLAPHTSRSPRGSLWPYDRSISDEIFYSTSRTQYNVITFR